MSDGSIRIEITGSSSDLQRAAKAAERALKDLDRENKKAAASSAAVSSAARRQNRDIDGNAKSITGLTGAMFNANTQAKFLGNTLRLFKWPAIAVGADAAAAALNDLAAAAFAVGGSLGRLAPLAGAIPGTLLGIAEAAGAAKLGTMGIADALKAAGQQSQKAAATASTAGRQQASAADAVAGAHQALSKANDEVRKSQIALTQAQHEAERQLVDLKNAATDASLAQKRAGLSLEEAKRNQADVNADPTASLLDRRDAALSVKEAEQALHEQQTSTKRAHVDNNRAQAAGVQGSDQVVQAREALKAAEESVASATRQVAAAQRQTAAATEKATGSVDKFAQAMAGLPPAAQDFVKTLLKLKPQLTDLRKVASQGLLPGVADGILAADKNFGVLRGSVHDMSGVLGDLAKQAGEKLGSSAWGKDLGDVSKRNAQNLGIAGDAAMHLAEALRDVMVAAGPLTTMLAKDVDHLAAELERMARDGRDSGAMADSFQRAHDELKLVLDIAEHLGSALLGIFSTGAPTGDSLLGELDHSAKRWDEWVHSIEGEHALREWFHAAKPAIEDVAGLMGDLAGTFVRLGKAKTFENLIDEIRTVLPDVETLVNTLGDAFGPVLIHDVGEFAKLLTSLGGHGGPLVEFARLIGVALGGINGILKKSGALRTLLVDGFAAYSLYKALKIGESITGLKTMRTSIAGLFTGKGGKLGTISAKLAGGVRGDTAALPMYVWVVNPGGAGGTGVAGAGKPGGPSGKIAAGGAAAGVAAGASGIVAGAVVAAGAAKAVSDAIGGGKQSDLGLLAQFNAQIERAKKNADTGAMRKLADQIRDVAQANSDLTKGDHLKKTADELDRLADQGGHDTSRMEKAIASLASSHHKNLSDIRSDLRTTADTITSTLPPASNDAKNAMSRAFFSAAAAVQDAMDKGRVATDTGIKEMNKLILKGLALYGMSAKDVKPLTNDVDAAHKAQTKATGGLMRLPGAPGPDSIPMNLGGVPVMAAPGEDIAVVNQHQRAVLDHRLSDMGGFAGLFQKVNRPHHMAGGGLVPGHPELKPGISKAVAATLKKFPGLQITATTNGHHASNSYHYRGMAADLAAPMDKEGIALMNSAAQWAGGAMGSQLTEGIHNPNLSVDGGKPVASSFWGAETWAGHKNHIHLAVAGLIKGAISGDPGALSQLKKIAFRKDLGAISTIGQAGLDMVRAAGQRVLNQAAGPAAAGDDTSGSGAVGHSTYNGPLNRTFPMHHTGTPGIALSPDQVVEIAQGSGLPGRPFEQIAHGESSYMPGIVEWPPEADGAQGYGLWQLTTGHVDPPVVDLIKRLGGWGQMLNPVKNAEAAKALYDIGGLGRWHGTRFLGKARGGLIGAASGLLTKAGKKTKPKHQPIAHHDFAKIKSHLPSKRIALLSSLLNQSAAIEADGGPLWVAQQNAALTDENQLTSLADGTQVRDEGGIARHVAELDGFIALKAQEARLVAQQSALAGEVFNALKAGIKARQDQIAEMRARIHANLKKRTGLLSDLHAERKKKGGGSDAKKRSLTKQIQGLEAENLSLGGASSELLDIGQEGGRIKATRADLTNWTDQRDGAGADDIGVAALTADMPRRALALKYDILQLQKERAEWTGTTAPAVDLSAAASSGADEAAALRADLLQQQLTQSQQAFALSQSELGTFNAFAPLLGGRPGFERGIVNVPMDALALLHKGETVSPAPNGPYGSSLNAYNGQIGGGGGEVHLHLHGDAANLVRLIDSRVDGAAPRIVKHAHDQLSRTVMQSSRAPGRR